MTDTGKADYIAARASESLSYGDIAYAQSQGWCSSSPDGMGPHRPDDTTDPVTCAECGAEIGNRWTVSGGRTVAFDGVDLFTVDGLSDVRGLRYIPAALDSLTRQIADALNAARIDGSEVAR